MDTSSTGTGTGRGETTRRVGWLALIWACSVAALGIFALGMRLLMHLAGMTP